MSIRVLFGLMTSAVVFYGSPYPIKTKGPYVLVIGKIGLSLRRKTKLPYSKDEGDSFSLSYIVSFISSYISFKFCTAYFEINYLY